MKMRLHWFVLKTTKLKTLVSRWTKNRDKKLIELEDIIEICTLRSKKQYKRMSAIIRIGCRGFLYVIYLSRLDIFCQGISLVDY